jgi:hypothetical protein
MSPSNRDSLAGSIQPAGQRTTPSGLASPTGRSIPSPTSADMTWASFTASVRFQWSVAGPSNVIAKALRAGFQRITARRSPTLSRRGTNARRPRARRPSRPSGHARTGCTIWCRDLGLRRTPPLTVSPAASVTPRGPWGTRGHTAAAGGSKPRLALLTPPLAAPTPSPAQLGLDPAGVQQHVQQPQRPGPTSGDV